MFDPWHRNSCYVPCHDDVIAQMLMDLARVLKHHDKPARAAETYHKVTLLEPENPNAHYKEASAWRAANRKGAAVDAFR